MVLDAASGERSSTRSPSRLPRLTTWRRTSAWHDAPPCDPSAAFSFEDQPRRLQACAFTYPDGTWARNGGAGSSIRRPVIRSRPGGDTSATIHPVPGISGLCGESVSAPSVAWFVDLASAMWARRGRRKEAESLPAVRALHLPHEDLPERPRSHQVTAGLFGSAGSCGRRSLMIFPRSERG
jgi:hypothetical protein